MSRLYLDLIAMADGELALAAAGRWDELPAAMERRLARASTLPAVPPTEARPLLERLQCLQDQLAALLAAGRVATVGEINRLDRGRGAVRGYQPRQAPLAGRVDGEA